MIDIRCFFAKENYLTTSIFDVIDPEKKITHVSMQWVLLCEACLLQL